MGEKERKKGKNKFTIVNGPHNFQFIYKKITQQRYLKTKN